MLNHHINYTYIEQHRDMKLKNSIKEKRQKKSLTQQELADLVGVSRQTIISIERYRYKPSLELGLRMAYALEVDINKLFYLDLEKIINITPSKKTKPLTKTKKFQDFKENDWKNLWIDLKNKI